ncbi:MAG: YceI family protein, partial [Bacteroidota bacterium]
STFNRFRDESLKEPEYFNVSQYPTMSFEGDDFAVTDDLIVLNGYFTMLGRRVDQVVEMKYVGSEVHNGQSYPILIGRGTIDRTRFGMRPDPKEGNVVNFNFRISLKK